MESNLIGDCFKMAWRDATGAIFSRPLSVLVIFLLWAASTYVADEVRFVPLGGVQAGLSAAGELRNALLVFSSSIINLMVIPVLAVLVMRYSTLGAEKSKSSRLMDSGFRRYLGLLIILALAAIPLIAAFAIFSLVGTLAFHMHGVVVAICATGIMLCIFIYLYLRVSLVFCHVALGGRTRWRAAWADTREHVWTIAAARFVTAAPLFGLVILATILKPALVRHFPSDSVTYAYAVATAACDVLGTSASAACSAWLYRRFAVQLRWEEALTENGNGLTTENGGFSNREVYSPQDRQSQKQAVTNATNLLWATLTLGIIKAFAGVNYSARTFPSIGYFIFLTALASAIGAYYILRISAGKNGTRITFLVLFVLGIASMNFWLPLQFARSFFAGVLSTIQIALQGYALFILFSDPARAWFRKTPDA
jgi:hypothetical protein